MNLDTPAIHKLFEIIKQNEFMSFCHISPCYDCPFRKDSNLNWSQPVEPWVEAVQRMPISCHNYRSVECAGAAIFRTNSGMKTEQLKLPASKEVFSSLKELVEHARIHSAGDIVVYSIGES